MGESVQEGVVGIIVRGDCLMRAVHLRGKRNIQIEVDVIPRKKV